jgi:hypothetical protein
MIKNLSFLVAVFLLKTASIEQCETFSQAPDLIGSQQTLVCSANVSRKFETRSF